MFPGIPKKWSGTTTSIFLCHVLPLSTQTSFAKKGSIPKLILYTGTDCQLCDVAKSVLDEIGKTVDFELKEYNIRDDRLKDVKRWRRAYQYGEQKLIDRERAQ